jgi:hypothetical protein
MNDIRGDRKGVLDTWTSDEGVQLYWATTIMFTKNQESKLYFELAKSIKSNYKSYAEIYRFDHRIYRNDIAFSISKHIIDGFETVSELNLPPILTAQDKDLIVDVNSNGPLMLMHDPSLNNPLVARFNNRDIHVMNKQSIVRSFDQFLGIL